MKLNNIELPGGTICYFISLLEDAIISEIEIGTFFVFEEELFQRDEEGIFPLTEGATNLLTTLKLSTPVKTFNENVIVQIEDGQLYFYLKSKNSIPVQTEGLELLE